MLLTEREKQDIKDFAVNALNTPDKIGAQTTKNLTAMNTLLLLQILETLQDVITDQFPNS